MSLTAENLHKHCERRLVQFYRSKARTTLAQARQARWMGREEAAAALVSDALWWRWFAHRRAVRARQEAVL
jgi:hypothetical protein